MFADRPMVKVTPAQAGKSVRIFPMPDGGHRALSTDAPFPVVMACAAMFGTRGEVRHLTAGDWTYAPFTAAELRKIGRA